MKLQLQKVLLSPNRLVLLILLGLTAVYLHGTSLQNHLVNIDPNQTDQLAYLTYAKNFRETNYQYVMPRNRMPAYPLLQSLAYRPGMSDEEFFVVGKDLNVILSLVFLAALYWLFQKFFSPLMTLNIMLITGFTVFMFKAPFFQPELLFYFLNFAGFLHMLKLFRKPEVKTGLIAGLVLGIAHLTKASIIVGLLLFLFFMTISLLADLFQKRPLDKIIKPKIAVLVIVAVAFLASISVYITNSKKIYGQFFYNVNYTFYIWYDSWSEVKVGTSAHGDRIGWPDLPDEEIPGPIKYLQEHTMVQILDRLQLGIIRVISNSVFSYGYFIYFLIYSLALLTICVLNWRVCIEKFKTNYVISSFIIAYFVLYFLAVAWYTPIAKGNRFILAYFLPYMFVLCYVLGSAQRYFGLEANKLVRAINFLVIFVLFGHIIYIMTTTIGSFYGGL